MGLALKGLSTLLLLNRPQGRRDTTGKPSSLRGTTVVGVVQLETLFCVLLNEN
jgi:hypothetical protein